MNHIQKIIKENVLDPEMLTASTSTFGYVLKYDKNTNTAQVSVFDKRLGSYIIHEDVYVCDNMAGVIGKNIDTSTPVWIDFIGGNKNMLRVSDLKPNETYSIENIASDNGQGVADIKGFFERIGDILTGFTRR